MPTYNYECSNKKCNHTIERIEKISDNRLKICPLCNQETLKLVLTNGSFILKGSKWASKSGY